MILAGVVLLLTSCAPTGFGNLPPGAVVADFPTSRGQAVVVPFGRDQLEVFVPGMGSFIINGVDVVDIQVQPLSPVAAGEVILIGTAYPGCNRDYFAITYGAWEPDFYRLGDCEQPMSIGFERDGATQAVVIQDNSRQLRYGVDRREMVRLDPAARGLNAPPPVPTARPDPQTRFTRGADPSGADTKAPTTANASRQPSLDTAPGLPPNTEFKLPPVGTLTIE